MSIVCQAKDLSLAFQAALFSADVRFVNYAGRFMCKQDTGKKH